VIDIPLVVFLDPTSTDHLAAGLVAGTAIGPLVRLRVIFLIFALVIPSHRKRPSATSYGSLAVS